MNYDLYWIWMSCGLGAGASCLDLVSYYEWNPQEIYGSSFNEIFSLDVLTKRQVEKLKKFSLDDAQKILDTVKSNGWKVITPSSKYKCASSMYSISTAILPSLGGSFRSLTARMYPEIVLFP